ncbi:unnamed protein product [Callosobruchus maculatus]|uniref:Uncharacterized protein n=1 Tax=Callosobruchus maculatus TaxID=64391 RepID=A0A653DHL4_CALMS|nr:unnamed protein product [Callosobruchus maculatus]
MFCFKSLLSSWFNGIPLSLKHNGTTIKSIAEAVYCKCSSIVHSVSECEVIRRVYSCCVFFFEVHGFLVAICSLAQFKLYISIAQDIKDIKVTQSRLSDDVTDCKTLLQQHSQKISEHEILIRSCQSNIAKIESNQTATNTNLEVLEKRLSDLESSVSACPNFDGINPTSESKVIPRAVIEAEALERLSRSHNVIILGIPETNNAEEYVNEILNQVDPVANAHRLNVVRLGSVSVQNRPRPVKVCFATPVVAKSVLRKKSILERHHIYSSTKITDDKTPAQLKELSTLREELKRRQTGGEKDLTIKYIKGSPRIVNNTYTSTKPQKN